MPQWLCLYYVLAIAEAADQDQTSFAQADTHNLVQEIVHVGSDVALAEQFVAALPACKNLARHAAIIGFGDGPGIECLVHELRQLQLVCTQLICIVSSLNAAMWGCLASSGESGDPLMTCGSHLIDLYPLYSQFSWPECGVGPASLAALSATGDISIGLFAVKQELYHDIDRRNRQCLVDIVAHAPRRFPFSEDLRICLDRLAVWGDLLGVIWWLYRVYTMTFPPSVVWYWPRFRLPDWRDTQGLRASHVLIRLATMLHQEQQQQKNASHRSGLVFVESGVCAANTSEEFLTSAGWAFDEVHLVDPWDGNLEMRLAAEWHGLQANATGDDVAATVHRKMAAIPGVVVCNGELMQSASACCHPLGGCIPVHLHRATSVTAALRFPHEWVDLVFLDGGHTLTEVLEDIAAWWPRVRPGGVIAGHDFHPLHPGVPVAVISSLSQLCGRSVETHDVFLDADTIFWFRKPR